MIFSITNPTELVDWLQIFCKSGWLSPWDPPLQWGKIHERSYRPATHPIHFAAVLPRQNLSPVLRGRYFSFWEQHLENFMSRPNMISAFQPTPLHKQGQELRSEQTVTHIHEQHNLYLFLRLNNSETITRKRFWAQRLRARTGPWPQIFNSWKCSVHPGLHFCNASAFPKWSCWGVPAPNPAE